jgi:hypothetical protein
MANAKQENKIAQLFSIQNAIAHDLSNAMPLDVAFSIVINHLVQLEEIQGGAFFHFKADGSLVLDKSVHFPELYIKGKISFDAISPESSLVLTGETQHIPVPNEQDYFRLTTFDFNVPWIIVSPTRLNGDIVGCMLLLGKENITPSEFLMLTIEGASYKIGGIIGRIEYENEISEKQQSFESIFKSLHDILIITNKEGKIIYFNQLLCQKSGYLEEELYALSIHQLFPDELAFDIKNIMSELNTVSSSIILFPIITSNKDVIPAETVISKVLWSGKQMLLWSIRDLKERKEAQEAIAIAKKKAENANEAKTAFLTNLSYTLRIPLSSILGMTELLLKTDLNKNQFNFLNVITRSTEQLMLIADQLLDISKIEKDELLLENKSFSLKDIIIQVINQQYYKAYNKGIEIICDYVSYGQDLVLKGDALRLSQILQNIVDNSVKFTDNGKIEIIIKPLQFHENSINIHFSIADTGKGMDAKTIKNILENCRRKSPVSNPSTGDFGIGLIIVYNLLKLMGSKLTIESEPFVGTSMDFELTLPMGQIDELSENNASSPFVTSIPSTHNINVLVAEDQPFNQMVVRSMLEEWGFKVECVENGKQVLDKLKQNHFDIILMDIYMPEMDGITATQHIRKEFEKPVCNIPIIAITANAYVSEHQKFMEAGMNDTISKPFKSQLLFHKIIHVLGLSKASFKENEKYPDDVDIIEQPTHDKFYNLTLLYNITRNQKSAVVKMLQVFIDKSNIELLQLEEFTLKAEWEKVSSIAHKMKPSLAYLSMKQVEEIIQQIYHLAKNEEQTERIPKLVKNAKDLLEYIIQQLKEEIRKLEE